MKTAVEWLVEQIKKDPNLRLRGFDIDGIAQQAKEMDNKFIEDYKIYKKYWEITAKLSITKDNKSK